MTKYLALGLVVAASFLTGCADPCGDLADVCPSCTDATEKASCETTVAADDLPLIDGDDACEAMLDDLPASCQ